MKKNGKIWILADANSEIGNGHLMRCIAIAQGVISLGGEVTFLIWSVQAVHILDAYLLPYILLTSKFKASSDNCLLDELKSYFQQFGKGPLLIDSYLVTEELLKQLTKETPTAYMKDFDGLGDTCTITINYLPSMEHQMEKVGVLKGLEYFPLRKELMNPSVKNIRKNCDHILVMIGGSKRVDGFSELLESLDKIEYKKNKYFIFVGNNFEKKSWIDNEMKMESSPLRKDVRSLFEWADIAVTAGGSTIYELASCGVPMIQYGIALNQKNNLDYFREHKMAKYAGEIGEGMGVVWKKVVSQINQLEQDWNVRKEWATIYQKLIDGQGSLRIAEHLMELGCL